VLAVTGEKWFDGEETENGEKWFDGEETENEDGKTDELDLNQGKQANRKLPFQPNTF